MPKNQKQKRTHPEHDDETPRRPRARWGCVAPLGGDGKPGKPVCGVLLSPRDLRPAALAGVASAEDPSEEETEIEDDIEEIDEDPDDQDAPVTRSRRKS